MRVSGKDFAEAAEEIFSHAPKARDMWNKSAATRSITAALTVLRSEAGLTQKEVADRAGWDKAFVSRLESGVGGHPDTMTITRYAAACGMEVGLVFASLKSNSVGHIHTALNISTGTAGGIFDRAAGQDFSLNAG